MSDKPLYIKMWQEVGGKQVAINRCLSPDVLKEENVEKYIAFNAIYMHQTIEKYKKEMKEVQ